ncbi:D-alanyl-D-alanine carboxypeptidase family protein [Cellulomonas sp. Marseille-Q8402]
MTSSLRTPDLVLDTTLDTTPGTAPEQSAPVKARGRRAAGPAVDAPPARDSRASAPSGRRAAAPGGRRAAEPAAPRGSHRADGRASVRTPSRGVPAVATLASADAPLNRADRRRRRAPRRSANRVAQGAVAVGLALGVGGFALTPSAAERASAGAAGAAAAAQGDAAADVDQTTPRLSSDVVQERQAAVVLASATAQQADTVKADAVASAVPAESVTKLATAVAELDTLIAATQSEQPALTALQADRDAQPASPLLTGDTLASAVEDAGADALADAAASAGATSTSDDVSATAEPSISPTEPTGTAADVAAVPEDPAAARLTAAVDRVATLTAELQTVTQQARDAAAAAAAAEEAARKEALRTSLDSYSNGQIPASALADLDFAPGQQLRGDAAEALEQLNGAFAAAFGTNLVITDSYRSYGQQVACRRQKGSLCATPGTSNHGNGTAIDLGGNAYSFGTDQHDWMLAHAEEFGWTLPDWARASGSKPEPWHWEYVG